jgi:polysaccharide export outer membrane protein
MTSSRGLWPVDPSLEPRKATRRMRRYLRKTVQSASALLMMAAILGAPTTGVVAQTRIQPGDKLELTVFNHPDLSSEMVVTSSGDIRLPIAGDVTVEGLSQPQATDRVQKALAPFLLHPSIDIRVVSQGQSIFFTGSLVAVAPYQPGETLGAAIGSFRQGASAPSGAGNLFNNVDLRTVRVERNKLILAAVDLEALGRSGDSGPRLEPGDVVLLQAKPVRIDVRGNLASPATVYVYRGDTLAQAVAQTGPLSATTSLTFIELHRDGVDSIVSAAGGAFTAPAHDGDIVTLQPAPRVSVLGMVEKSGDTTLQTRPTLLNALYEAGGPNRYADLGHVQVSHEGVTRVYDIAKITHGDLSQNADIHDGDVIFVPEGHRIDLTGFTTALGALSSLKFLTGI